MYVCRIVIGCTGKRHSEFTYKTIPSSWFDVEYSRKHRIDAGEVVCDWTSNRWNLFFNFNKKNQIQFCFIEIFLYLFIKLNDLNSGHFVNATQRAKLFLDIQNGHTMDGAMSVDNFTMSANFGTFLNLSTTFSIGFRSLSWSGMTLSAICLTMNPSSFT